MDKLHRLWNQINTMKKKNPEDEKDKIFNKKRKNYKKEF